jgi:cysteine sulfinate desulfinase/cysteine desulfurase-like protein
LKSWYPDWGKPKREDHENMSKPIYLDYNGTTPHAPEVIQAMLPFLESEFGNPSSISFLGLEADRLLAKISPKVAVSAGAACHADQVEISHVLRAMRVPEQWARGTLRFSTGRYTTADEIDLAVEVVVETVRRLRG